MGFPFCVQGGSKEQEVLSPTPLYFLRAVCILQLVSYNDWLEEESLGGSFFFA